MAVAYLCLVRRMKPWTKAIVFGAISAALIVLIYATPSPEPGYAGTAFVYNFLFFFPVVIVSFGFWASASVFYVQFLRDPIGRSALKVISPVVLLLPFALQAAWIIRIVLLLHKPA